MSWILWLTIALACVAIEVFTTDFTFLMLACGSFAAAGTAVATHSIWIQLAVFALVAASLLVLVRPWAKNHFNTRGSKIGSADNLLGSEATALTDIDATSGRVKIHGDEWSARTRAGTIPAGATVLVAALDGVTAIVETAPEQREVRQ